MLKEDALKTHLLIGSVDCRAVEVRSGFEEVKEKVAIFCREFAHILNSLAHLLVFGQILVNINALPTHKDSHRYFTTLAEIHIKLNLPILRYLQAVNSTHHFHVEVRWFIEES
jgi:hypothetical protein